MFIIYQLFFNFKSVKIQLSQYFISVDQTLIKTYVRNDQYIVCVQ